MKPFHQYWTFSAIRGVMTVVASVAIFAVPQAASSMLSLPILIGLTIDCFAAYSLIDGGVIVLLAKLLPARATNRNALYGQMLVAISTGVLLFLVVYGALGVRWLMWIAAMQAAFAALAELIVARDTHRQYGCLSCYSTALVLGVSALALPFAGGLSAVAKSFALASYVGLYGASELFLSARMLFSEYRSEHPALVASEASRLAMVTAPAAKGLSSATGKAGDPGHCDECPAIAFCLKGPGTGQAPRVLAKRQPAIVVSMRVDNLLKEAAAPVSR